MVAAQTVVTKGVVRKGTTIPQKTTVVKPFYDVNQLSGKWQETKRTNLSSNKKVSFQDTMQLNFSKRDSVSVRDGVHMTQKGYAAVEGTNQLAVAGDVYTIISLSKNVLVLNDGEYIRELQRRKKFYHETLGTIIIPKEDLSQPEIINLKKVIGKWDVYRTQATPGVAEDSAVIKNLAFTQVNENGTVSGEVTFTKATLTETLPVNAIFENGTLRLSTLKHSWDMYTYKADGKEFIFGKHGGLVYFAKQL